MSKSNFIYLAAVDEKAQTKPKPDVSSGFDNLITQLEVQLGEPVQVRRAELY